VAAYALTKLVSDVIAIAEQLGKEKIFLAGHDWGAAVAWNTPSCTAARREARRPQRPSSLGDAEILSTRPRQNPPQLVRDLRFELPAAGRKRICRDQSRENKRFPAAPGAVESRTSRTNCEDLGRGRVLRNFRITRDEGR